MPHLRRTFSLSPYKARLRQQVPIRHYKLLHSSLVLVSHPVFGRPMFLIRLEYIPTLSLGYMVYF